MNWFRKVIAPFKQSQERQFTNLWWTETLFRLSGLPATTPGLKIADTLTTSFSKGKLVGASVSVYVQETSKWEILLKIQLWFKFDKKLQMKSVLLLWYLFQFSTSLPWFTVDESRLRKFNAESVTECFDQLTTSQSSSRPLHFVFIGDSRMRQQFYSFLEVSLVLTFLFESITVDCTVFTRSRPR